MTQPRVQMLLNQRIYTWDTESWFPPMEAVLSGLTAAQAAWQPPGGGNTIWQTLNHLNFYNEVVLGRITGKAPSGTQPDNTATFGGAPDPTDEAGWQETVAQAKALAATIAEELGRLTDADLDKVQGEATLGERLATWALHDAHHSGQIVLIRKQQGSWPATRF